MCSKADNASSTAICQSRELDLHIVIDCQHPPRKWDMIRNIIHLFPTSGSGNTTQKLSVTLIDMFSLNNMTVEKSNMNNVSELCQLPTNQTELETFKKRLSNLVSNVRRGNDQDSESFAIYIFHDQQNIVNEFLDYSSNFTNSLMIAISDRYWVGLGSFGNVIEVDGEDDLLYNNELSLKLCSRCLKGWFPTYHAENKLIIKSCLRYEKEKKRLTWQDAANYCAQKRSHLITFETRLDFTSMQSTLENIVKNFSKTNFKAKEPVLFHIGLNTLNARLNEKLFWINSRPVNSFMYSLIKNPSLARNSKKDCFVWDLTGIETKDKVIFNVLCGDKRTNDLLCEQELLKSSDSLKISHSNILTYEVPNNNFIKIKNVIAAISNNFVLNPSGFPLFHCGYNDYPTSFNFVCDGFLDCLNGEDEQICKYEFDDLNICIRSELFVCRNPNVHGLKCISKRHVCDMIEDCPGGSDESNCDDCTLTQCSPNVCIPDHWTLNCSSLSQEKKNGTSEKEYRINNTFLGPNLKNSELITICDSNPIKNTEKINDLNKYNRIWTPKCVYIKDRQGAHIGCTDFSHLSNCSSFDCPEGFSKCWNSYCIPDTFVNDGVKDCPHGEDEERHYHNTGWYFKCYFSFKEFHPIYVCDGKIDCPRGDDELNCGVPHCPSGLICRDGTITVNDTNTLLDMSSLSPDITFLNISGIDLSKQVNLMNLVSFRKLLVIIASRCNIHDQTRIKAEKRSVYHLDISYNNLSQFSQADLVSHFSNLYFLNVSHNAGLSVIPRFYFRRFLKLTLLDLSFTRITEINVYFNAKIRFLNLSVTNLEHVKLSEKAEYRIIDFRKTRVANTIKEEFFNDITVKGKVLADFKLCCPYFRGEKLTAHQCEAEEETLSTCEDLIGDSLKRVLLWIVAICAVFGNMIALGYRIIFERATFHLTYVLFVTCLGVSDLLMGIYLVIIASVDVVYRGVYIVHENSWKQSTLCQLAGTLATLSSETSTFFILFITLERFLTIRFPFGEHKISKSGKYVLTSVAWCFGLFLSVVPILFRDMSLYSNNGMCLGFPLRKSSGTAWIYSVTVFLFFNSILFVVIAMGQLLIFITISQHSSKFKTESQSSARRADNITVALKLSVVVLSNFICWFPVCILAIRTVVSDYEVTRETYAWIIALVLPINSALNPVLYTLPRISKSWTDFKRRKSSQYSNS
ncbi:G-protein coupled receptor GRL101 [Biomphalaria glabrata]|nr:G-protein coupled receptor [Biomphalaria glabrata]